MRFGLFYEHQLPRPWDSDAEARVLREAIEQIELADRTGIDHVWEVEHHFLEEYSHSSAPEVFLAAVSQRTERIRLGHGIVQLPPAVNHPARVAERISTLDLLSEGRVDFGTGEGSSQVELGGFGVPREEKRAQWTEALDVVTRMMVEEPFTGHRGRWIDVPPRNVVPKPFQKPHPPLWVACSRRETIELAARKGIGALSFSFVEPEEAKPWVETYYDLLASPECVPAGYAVNPNLAVVVPFMCHADEETAIQRGIDGAHFFGYSLAHYYVFGEHVPGRTDVWAQFDDDRRERGFARDLVAADRQPLSLKILQQGVGSMRGAVGTPDQVTDLLERYRAAGVDQVIFVAQAGPNRHDHVCEAIELFGREVLPRFVEGREEAEQAKAERLGEVAERALARREDRDPAEPVDAYVVQPQGELRAAPTNRPVGERVSFDPRTAVEDAVRRQVRRALQALSPERLEQLAVRPATLTVLFKGWERLARPTAGGEEATVRFDLRTDGTVDQWVVRAGPEGVEATHGSVDDPDAVLTAEAADFLRVAAELEPAGKALFEERLQIDGDLGALTRVVSTIGGDYY